MALGRPHGGEAVLVGRDGQVLAEGTPAQIIDNAQVRKVYLGENFRM